jgi:hypothetical protein
MSAPSGFDPHWDGHGVLVMQLEGSKQWTLFDGVHGQSLLPRPHMQKVVTTAELGASRDVVLHPGTVMFLPTGKIHKAKPVRADLGTGSGADAGAQHSVHLTMGFELDLLHTPSGFYHLIIGSLPKLNKPLRGLKVKAFQSCPKGLSWWLPTSLLLLHMGNRPAGHLWRQQLLLADFALTALHGGKHKPGQLASNPALLYPLLEQWEGEGARFCAERFSNKTAAPGATLLSLAAEVSPGGKHEQSLDSGEISYQVGEQVKRELPLLKTLSTQCARRIEQNQCKQLAHLFQQARVNADGVLTELLAMRSEKVAKSRVTDDAMFRAHVTHLPAAYRAGAARRSSSEGEL